MKYNTKSAQYYRYFEDAKLIEIDNENKKLAIVLFGKEEIIDIFDAGPYVDYNPFEYYIKELKSKYRGDDKDKKYGSLQIRNEPSYLNANEIFEKIQNSNNNQKNQINIFNNNNNYNLNFKNNLNTNNSDNKKLLEGQKLFLYEKYQNLQKKKDCSTLQMLSILDKKKENKENKEEETSPINKYDSLSISKFQIYYLVPFYNFKGIKLNPKKPKIKHKLLSVINIVNDNILGMKWFCFNSTEDVQKLNENKNLSEIEKYIEKSKLLLVVGQDGLISVYKLSKYEPFNHIRVNLTLSGLQTQPFSNFKERYDVAASLKLFNPIIDFNLLYKPIQGNNQNELRLITLHIDNTFTFWYIVNQNNEVKLIIQYNFQLSSFVCENFLMDSHEDYLICFNKKGITILLVKDQSFPFPVVYRYIYNETVPSLKELKELIYNNDIIHDENENENENVPEEGEKIEDNEEDEKIEDDEEKEEKEEEEEEKKEEKTRKKRKYVKSGKYVGKNKKNKKKTKNKTKDKDKKKNKNQQKKVKNDKNKNKKKKNSDDNDLFIIKRDNDEEEEEEEDDFIVEGNSDFIDKDEGLFYEDDKYLKFLQKPIFLSFETKFLFVNYEIKANQYSLYCFNFKDLCKIEVDKNFLTKCLNEYDDILIKKIFISKEKIYISESPFCYFNPVNDKSIDKNLLSTIESRRTLRQQKFDIDTILTNLYQGLFIREGDNIIIIKISVNDQPNLELINKDIQLSKYIFYEQPTSENLKSNYLAIWTINNTLLINSVNSLFTVIKFRKEAAVLGIAISKKKVIDFMKLSINN